MRYAFLTAFLSLIAVAAWSTPLVCGQSIDCFLKAAASCSPAQVTLFESGETSELVYKTKRQMIIHGPNDQKCLYQDLLQSVTLDLPRQERAEAEKKGWSEDLIVGQINSIARSKDLVKNLSRECEISSEELINLLDENFIQKKYIREKWAKCKTTILSAEVKKEIIKEKINTEDNSSNEDEDDENEDEVEKKVPTYLQFPYSFNAITYLKNSMAEISPYLGKKIDTVAAKPQTIKRNQKTDLEIEKEIDVEVEPMLIFKSTGGATVIKVPIAKAVEIDQNLTKEKPFTTLNKNERLQVILHGYPAPTGKPRLSALMSYDEMVKAGYSNDEIGAFTMKQVAENRAALEKSAECSSGCPTGTHCQSILKRCVQCNTAGECPGSQICLNYKCVSGDTIVRPEKR